MKLKLGARVFDRWWTWWGVGIVVKVLKTRVHVQFTDQKLVYDTAHLQFLRLEGGR